MTALLVLVLAALAAEPARDDASWKYFGAPFTVATAAPASTLLADPAAHAGGPVRFQGELTEVCQHMGCWANVRDDAGHSVTIRMKDHAFGIDKDTVGRACDVEGTFVQAGGAWEVVATSVAVHRP